jgi:hypothetical protein
MAAVRARPGDAGQVSEKKYRPSGWGVVPAVLLLRRVARVPAITLVPTANRKIRLFSSTHIIV